VPSGDDKHRTDRPPGRSGARTRTAAVAPV